MRICRLHLKFVIRNVKKEPRDACARGFFMPESQGLNAKFDGYYVLYLLCTMYITIVDANVVIFFGKDEEKLVNC